MGKKNNGGTEEAERLENQLLVQNRGKALCSPSEAARLLGYNVQTIRRYIRDGFLPAAQLVSGGAYTLRVASLARLVLKRERG